MIPAFVLAAGLLAQSEAKHQSVKAQKKETRKEAERQLGFQKQASGELHKELDAYQAHNRLQQDQDAETRMRTTGDDSANDAIRLFEGSGVGGAGAGSTAMAVRGTAGRNSAAFAGLNGRRVGQNQRRRLGLDIGANIAGIRQRSQRSLGLLPGRLERASQHGQGLNTVGQLMAAYGYGGMSDWAGNAGATAAANADTADYYGRPRGYTEQSPGATDLWGESDPYYAQA